MSDLEKNKKLYELGLLLVPTIMEEKLPGEAGIITIATLAPNMFQALKFLRLDKKLKQRKQSSITRARGRLIEKGILKQITTAKGKALKLTTKGEQLYEKISFSRIVLKRQKKWDKRWRMLVFDIIEERKGDRDEISRVLKKMDFLMIQDSVYIYPYPCDEFVALLKANFRIGKNLLYLIVEQIENDKKFREHFNIVK